MYLEDYNWWLVKLSNDLSHIALPIANPLVVNLDVDFLIGIKYSGLAICHISLPHADSATHSIEVYVPGLRGGPDSVKISDYDLEKPIQNIFLRPEIFSLIEGFIRRAEKVDFEGSGEKMICDLRKLLEAGRHVP